MKGLAYGGALALPGASQRTRREDLFGGVTRYVLQHLSVPVLMAH